MIDYRQDEESADVACDFCSHSETYEDMWSWQDVIDRMKDEGWKIRKVDDEWQHRCPGH